MSESYNYHRIEFECDVTPFSAENNKKERKKKFSVTGKMWKKKLSVCVRAHTQICNLSYFVIKSMQMKLYLLFIYKSYVLINIILYFK